MKSNYPQILIAVRLMTYIHVKLTLLVFLFELYKKHVEKKVKSKWFLEDKKNQNKIYECTENRIK